MSNNDYIEILYNDFVDGFFEFSKEAFDLYNERKQEIDTDYEPVLYYEDIKRDDPILIEIHYELQDKFNTENSLIKRYRIPQKYKDHYSIEENHDGTESICIFNDRYMLDEIEKILHNVSSSDEKIKMINCFFHENI
jgi:hypothetical protein